MLFSDHEGEVLVDAIEDGRIVRVTGEYARRKGLAFALGASENDMKMIEHGILPAKDYVLVRKIEEFFSINLRKDSVNAPSLQKMRNEAEMKKEESEEIELLDDE